MRKILRSLPLIVMVAGIPLLSLLPAYFFRNLASKGFLAFPHADKVVHACMYGLLSGAALFAFPFFRRGKQYFLVFFGATLYGVMMELGQKWLTRGRSADIGDAFANAVGALIAIFAVAGIRWIRGRMKIAGSQKETEKK